MHRWPHHKEPLTGRPHKSSPGLLRSGEGSTQEALWSSDLDAESGKKTEALKWGNHICTGAAVREGMWTPERNSEELKHKLRKSWCRAHGCWGEEEPARSPRGSPSTRGRATLPAAAVERPAGQDSRGLRARDARVPVKAGGAGKQKHQVTASLPTTATWGEPLDFSESYLPPNGDAQKVKGQNKCKGHCKRNDGFSGLVCSSSCPQTIPTCTPLSSPLLLSDPSPLFHTS